MPYWKSVLIALDQLINALIGGWPDETMSSAAHRGRLAGKPILANCIDVVALLFGDSKHCKESFESERTGRHLPPELRPMMEKTTITYNEFVDEIISELRDKLQAGKISQEQFDKARKHIQEGLEAQAG